MRAYVSLALLVTVSLLASSAAAEVPAARPIDPQAIIRSCLDDDEDEPVEIRSFSPPVKASSCRIYNSSKGMWVPIEQGTIALRVRYRKTSTYAKPLRSEVFFLDAEGGIVKIAEASAVRSSDPALMK